MKHPLTLSTFILALAISCSIDTDKALQQDTQGAFDRLYASIESSGSEDQTKVYLGEDVRLYWNVGDMISFFNKEMYNYQYEFKGNDGDRSGEFDKVSTIFHSKVPIDHVFAVYPYSSTTEIDDEEIICLYLPAVQTYSPGSFGRGANTMVSAGEDDNLFFKNTCGYLCFKFYAEGKSIKSVSLTGKGGEKIAGTATVTMEPGGDPVLAMSGQSSGTVAIECDEPVTLGSSAEEATQFWFVLPPVDFTDGLSVTLTDSEGNTFTKSTDKDFTIKRNSITRIAAFEVFCD